MLDEKFIHTELEDTEILWHFLNELDVFESVVQPFKTSDGGYDLFPMHTPYESELPLWNFYGIMLLSSAFPSAII